MPRTRNQKAPEARPLGESDSLDGKDSPHSQSSEPCQSPHDSNHNAVRDQPALSDCTTGSVESKETRNCTPVELQHMSSSEKVAQDKPTEVAQETPSESSACAKVTSETTTEPSASAQIAPETTTESSACAKEASETALGLPSSTQAPESSASVQIAPETTTESSAQIAPETTTESASSAKEASETALGLPSSIKTPESSASVQIAPETTTESSAQTAPETTTESSAQIAPETTLVSSSPTQIASEVPVTSETVGQGGLQDKPCEVAQAVEMAHSATLSADTPFGCSPKKSQIPEDFPQELKRTKVEN